MADHEKELTPEQAAEMFTYLRNIVSAPAGTPRPPLPDFIPEPQPKPEQQSQPWFEKKAAPERPLTKEEESDQWGPEEGRMVFEDEL